MSKARDLADFQGSASALTTGTLPVDRVPYVGRRNLIINGGFDVWQRGTSGASIGYFFQADRWRSYGYSNGPNTTFSRQEHPVGQTTEPFNTRYYARLDCSSNRAYLTTKLEAATSLLSGRQVTISFWAKSSASADIKFGYNADTGVTTNVTAEYSIGQLSEDWGKFTHTFTAPDVSGQSFSAGEFFELWLTNDTTGTLDIAEVQLELGSVATPFEHRSYGEELALCQRYYFTTYSDGNKAGDVQSTNYFIRYMDATSNWGSVNGTWPVQMRVDPSCSVYRPSTGQVGVLGADSGSVTGSVHSGGTSKNGFFVHSQNQSVGTSVGLNFHITADAEL